MYNHKRDKVSEIPMNVFIDIMGDLKSVFPDVTVIGGRAANIWNFGAKRNTNDIDVVIGRGPSTEDVSKLEKLGFFAEIGNNNQVKALMFRDKLIGEVQIDLFYSRPVNGMSTEMIIEHSEEKELGSKKRPVSVRVVDKALLYIMKLDSGREHDFEDARKILHNYYSYSTANFIAQEKELIEKLKAMDIDNEFIRKLKMADAAKNAAQI